ncbi:MAG: molecular chaperone DnaK [Chthoniobacterales bacterium]|nr:molecular chaperone DnaK [Chthoniobacterales bacterium]
MSDIVGIDLGTTNSLIGIMEAGFPILLADANGERLTPSVVHFPTAGEPLVGRAAARMRAIAPAQTIYSAKRFVGLRGDELRGEDAEFDFAVERAPGQPVRVRAGAGEHLPEEISAYVLRKLKKDAENALGREVSRAVITVPAYFNDAQRNATKRAGELAGFSVERILNEPTAAALAYGLDRLKERSKIAVFDLGGGTFDVSILELNNGVFEVLSTNGNTHLGGDDIDAALLEECSRRIGVAQLSAQQRAVLRDAVIDVKHRLSSQPVASIDLPFFDGDRSVSLTLTRGELEQLARSIVEKARSHCLRALADAKLKPQELDEVILVGGVTRMPIVQQFVAEIFDHAPNVSQNPDEAVALGATIQAGILSGAVRDVVLLDVTPLSLGIETFGGLMNVIIPRNSTIPIKAGEMFTTAVNNQTAMRIKVLQGEREMACDNWPLGEFELAFEAAPKGVARVGVQFEIDANGILHVLARDTRTGAEKIVEVNSAVDVSDEAVEAMISESLDHAFEDMNERVWTEAKLKAEEMIRAVQTAFTILAENIPLPQKTEVQGMLTELREALDSGEVQRLKRANAALDEATEPLAALLLEKALAENAGTPATM